MKHDSATAQQTTADSARNITDLLVLAAIVGLAIWLRSWRLNERGLWLSEAISWRLTRFDWGEVVAHAALDSNPPLYYLLLKAWTVAFGASAMAMRALSVLAGATACAATYLFVHEAYQPARSERSTASGTARYAALLSAALIATSVFQVRWSWEVRMYSLGVFFAAISGWSLVRALHRGGGCLIAWAIYAAAALAFAYIHTFALISIAAQAFYAFGHLFLVIERDGPPGANVSPAAARQSARRWAGPCLAAALIAAGYMPWIRVLIGQHAQVSGAFWVPPLAWRSIAWVARQMFIDPGAASGGVAGWVCAGACAVGLTTLAFRAAYADWLLLLSAVLPIGAAAAVSACDTSIFYSRYFIFAHIFILVSVARLASRLASPPVRSLIAFIAVGSSVLVDHDLYARLAFEDTGGIRAAARYLDERHNPKDLVVVCSAYFYLPLRYELGEDTPCRLLESGRLLLYQGTAVLAPHDFISPRDAAQAEVPRLWVVSTRGRSADLRLPPDLWRFKSRRSFYENYAIPGDLTIVEYERISDGESGAKG